MFVRSYVELPASFVEVEAELLRAPSRWIPGLARRSHAWGSSLLADVGFGPKSVGVRKQVRIDVGRPVRSQAKTLIPIRWQATHTEGLFPTMEADLEVAAIGPGVTQLSLDGRYVPPLGRAGAIADRTLMHRVAEATVRDFVGRVGRRLMQDLAEQRAETLSRR